ncbi:hypothetical protein [Rhodocyclus gracilis]|uniref:Uncharacterized protein n=1 Tax=Rhodocyclus tenuis TaxID=1066 RepID=A0A6L5JVS4_RHOTE|nr:hypothetical protein [Rhodocyclus gracilis]
MATFLRQQHWRRAARDLGLLAALLAGPQAPLQAQTAPLWAGAPVVSSAPVGPVAPTANGAGVAPVDATTTATQEEAEDGLRFRCPSAVLPALSLAVRHYLATLDIEAKHYTVTIDHDAGTLRFTLNTPASDTNTLTLAARAEFGIVPERYALPAKRGVTRTIRTVSAKEIVLALMQHGRRTDFAGDACRVDALREHVGIRQNIVAWAEDLKWGWPDRRPARWNRAYWRDGNLRKHRQLAAAVNDAFQNPRQYEIGCYTATKLVIIQGILDYYTRIEKNPATARLIEARLLADKDPLAHLEPGNMWDFDSRFNPTHDSGKLLRVNYNIASDNFVPGDWSYFLNTDPVSRDKNGYEGSNPIYLGQNRFVDYYNEHHHSFTFEEKLDDIYQWRHAVFNRQRDRDNIQPLSSHDYERLSQSPERGGLLTTLRTTPCYFGFEALQHCATPASTPIAPVAARR